MIYKHWYTWMNYIIAIPVIGPDTNNVKYINCDSHSW